jgi:hypothetical protein
VKKLNNEKNNLYKAFERTKDHFERRLAEAGKGEGNV